MVKGRVGCVEKPHSSHSQPLQSHVPWGAVVNSLWHWQRLVNTPWRRGVVGDAEGGCFCSTAGAGLDTKTLWSVESFSTIARQGRWPSGTTTEAISKLQYSLSRPRVTPEPKAQTAAVAAAATAEHHEGAAGDQSQQLLVTAGVIRAFRCVGVAPLLVPA